MDQIPLPATAEVHLTAEDVAEIDISSSEVDISIECEDYIEEGQFIRRAGSTLIDVCSPDGPLQFLIQWEFRLVLEHHWRFKKELVETVPPFEEGEGDGILAVLEGRVPIYEEPQAEEHQNG